MQKLTTLRPGEKSMPKAPLVKLSNGQYCIPQHYLTYHHTLESVEALICDIDYDPRYIVFAAQELGCIYIQVGVVGHDNYSTNRLKKDELKLLFGRKWRVEPELPTSEIIQSVFLAIKKSREHEVRELFKLNINNSVTTPFNTHIDLPLMASFYNKQEFKNNIEKTKPIHQRVTHILSCITYDQNEIKLKEIEQRKNGLWLIDVEIKTNDKSTQYEILNNELNLQVKNLSLNTISRALMDKLISNSDLHVDENFSYQGFHRFDPNIDIADIADLSQQSRKHELAEHFKKELKKSNYETDKMRIPKVQPGPLADKYKSIIARFDLPQSNN